MKTDAPAGKDIENTAGQIVHYYNPRTNTVEKPNKPTEKRVNSVPVPLELNFTKKLDGRQLKANEFTFVLKKDGVEVERAKNDALMQLLVSLRLTSRNLNLVRMILARLTIIQWKKLKEQIQQCLTMAWLQQ